MSQTSSADLSFPKVVTITKGIMDRSGVTTFTPKIHRALVGLSVETIGPLNHKEEPDTLCVCAAELAVALHNAGKKSEESELLACVGNELDAVLLLRHGEYA